MMRFLGVAAMFAVLYFLDRNGIVSSTLISLLYFLTLIYAGYLVVKTVSEKKKDPAIKTVSTVARQSDPIQPVAPPKKRPGTVIVIILVVLAIVFIKYLGIISINFILFMNRLLHVTSLASAVILWALTGLFVGLIYGTFVACKKFRLNAMINIFPFAALGIFIAVFFFLNDPLEPRLARTSTSEDAFRFISVRSSGYLPGPRQDTYSDSNLVDRDDNTAWIENAKNAGVGEWIEFRFTKVPEMEKYRSFTCTGFHIRNGYAKTQKLWASYNRLREFRVAYNGSDIGNFTAGNVYKQQETISIAPFRVKYDDVITVYINSVYYGNKNFKMTAITELVPIVEYVE